MAGHAFLRKTRLGRVAMHVFAACFTPRLDRVLQRDPDALVERARACVTLEQHAHYVPERASTLQCRRRLIADQVGSSCSSDASYDGDFQGFTSARRFRCTVQMDGVSVATVCVLPTWHRSYEHMAESCGVARATEASTQRKKGGIRRVFPPPGSQTLIKRSR